MQMMTGTWSLTLRIETGFSNIVFAIVMEVYPVLILYLFPDRNLGFDI